MLQKPLKGIVFYESLVRLALVVVAISSTCMQAKELERIQVESRGFSILPPQGWEAKLNQHGISLFMQAPLKKGGRYRSNIKVFSFGDPKSVDIENADQLAADLVQKFSALGSNVIDYRVRNYLPVKLKDGNKALLIYTEFKLNSTALMQANLLLSSKTRHYLITYTDLATLFEITDQPSGPLTAAWESMISMRVDALPARQLTRFEMSILISGIVVLLLVMFWYLSTRSEIAKRKYDAESRALERAAQDDLSDHFATSVTQPRSNRSSKHARKVKKISNYDVDDGDDMAS